MDVKFDVISKMKEDFEGFINTFDHPIIVIDNNMKILTKNNAARFYIGGMDIGKTATGYFSDDEELLIRSLNYKETVFCELKCRTASYGANVFGLGEQRMIVVNPVSSRLCESIRTMYDRMSGYDMSLSNENLFGEELSRRLRTKAASAFVTERLRDIFTTRKLPYFDLHKTVADFVCELKSLDFPVSFESKISNEDTIIVAGSEGDFLLLLAVVVFLSEFGDEGIAFEIESEDNKIFCRITSDALPCSDDTQHEASFSVGGRFDGEFGEKHFWSHLAYLIANANLWDVSVETLGDKTIFTLSAELTSYYTGCVFRDEKNSILRQLTELFFAEPQTKTQSEKKSVIEIT